MIWMSSNKLEHALAEGNIDSWTKVKYLIFPAVLAVVSGGPLYAIRPYYGNRIPMTSSFVFIFSGIIAAVLTYKGIKGCFYANQYIDDKAFFERFAILLVPPLIQIALFSVLLTLGILYYTFTLREEMPSSPNYASLLIALLGPIMTYVLYFFVQNSFIRLGILIEENLKSSESAGVHK